MKKIVALILAIALMVTCLCGCGGSGDDGGDAKLYFALQWSYQKDYDEVLKAINEELNKQLPGTQIEFLMDMAYETKWSLWMAGKTQIDICLSGWPLSLAEDIQNDCFMPLDDLVKEYAPTVEQEWKDYEAIYQTGIVNDTLYAIPNIQININEDIYWGVPEDLYQFVDTKAIFEYCEKNPTCTEEFYKLIDGYMDKASAYLKKKNDDRKPYIDMEHFQANVVRRGFDFTVRDSDYCYRVFDKDGKIIKNPKIIDIHDTEEYKTYIKWTNKWYKKGYISKDAVTSASATNIKYILNIITTSFDQYDTDGDNILKPGEHLVSEGKYMIRLTPPKWEYSGVNVIGKWSTYFSIPNTAKYPERAMKFIELLRTEKGADLLNLIIYGFEGTHYDEIEDGYIKAREYSSQGTSGSSYGIPFWMISSSINPNKKTVYPYTPEFRDSATKYYNRVSEMPRTPLYGVTFDTTSVAPELAMLKSVNEEYEKQLTAGIIDDYNKLYKEFMDKRAAGNSLNIIKEFQKQADANKK